MSNLSPTRTVVIPPTRTVGTTVPTRSVRSVSPRATSRVSSGSVYPPLVDLRPRSPLQSTTVRPTLNRSRSPSVRNSRSNARNVSIGGVTTIKRNNSSIRHSVQSIQPSVQPATPVLIDTEDPNTMEFTTHSATVVPGSDYDGEPAIITPSVRSGTPSIRSGTPSIRSITPVRSSRVSPVRSGSMRSGSMRSGSMRSGSMRSGSMRSTQVSPVRSGSMRSGSMRSTQVSPVRSGSMRVSPMRSDSMRVSPVRSGSMSITPPVMSGLRHGTTVRTVNSETVEMEDETGIMHLKSVEDMLAEHGFIITDKVFIDQNGVPKGKYVIVSVDGGRAIVEFDEEYKILYSPADGTMIATLVGTVVPESTVVSLEQCTNSTGCGVGFVCDGEICIRSRSADSSDSPTTVVLKELTTSSKKLMSISGVPVPYPVVRLSDVMADPVKAKHAIEESTRIIRNEGYVECTKHWSDLSDTLATLVRLSTSYGDKTDEYFSKLGTDNKILVGIRNQYRESSPVNEEDQMRYDLVIENLSIRTDMINRLFALCNEVPLITESIAEVVKRIEQGIEKIDENSKHLGEAIGMSSSMTKSI
jgi:hypothetical protein